jgi:hypothetical protein
VTGDNKTPASPKRVKNGNVAKLAIVDWPERKSAGLGSSIKDGWNFGIGFGLAMTVALPLMLMILGCVIGLAFMIFGTALAGLVSV